MRRTVPPHTIIKAAQPAPPAPAHVARSSSYARLARMPVWPNGKCKQECAHPLLATLNGPREKAQLTAICLASSVAPFSAAMAASASFRVSYSTRA